MSTCRRWPTDLVNTTAWRQAANDGQSKGIRGFIYNQAGRVGKLAILNARFSAFLVHYHKFSGQYKIANKRKSLNICAFNQVEGYFLQDHQIFVLASEMG